MDIQSIINKRCPLTLLPQDTEGENENENDNDNDGVGDDDGDDDGVPVHDHPPRLLTMEHNHIIFTSKAETEQKLEQRDAHRHHFRFLRRYKYRLKNMVMNKIMMI